MSKPNLRVLSYGKRLTEEQYRAAATVEHSLAVTAGAGAGKTGVLVARFIALLQAGAQPEQVVAITFTRKAAAEMLERLQKELQLLSAVDPRAQDWLLALPSAQISTIHSLASKLLRTYPIQIRVDPAFRMLEEFESRQLLRQSCQEALELWLLQQGPRAAIDLIEWNSQQYQDALLSLIVRLRNRGENMVAMIERVRRTNPTAEPLPFAAYARRVAAGAAEGISSRATKVLASAEELVSLLQRAADASDDRQVLLELNQCLADIWSQKSKAAQTLRDLLDGLNEGEAFLSRFGQVFNAAFQEEILSLVAMLEEALRRFREAKDKLGGLDYGDLEERALQLLRENPEVRDQVRQQWRFFLVDEFQDVNFNQSALVELLCGERIDEALFICGDPKQSIYRFRGAVVELFEAMSQRLSAAEEGRRIVLADNFRTLEPILNLVNLVFSGMMEERYQAMRSNRASLRTEPCLELLLSEGEKSEEIRLNEAEAIACRLRRMVDDKERLVQEREGDQAQEQLRPVRYGDIALLFQTRSSMDLYEAALRSQGIPSLQLGGRSFYGRPEIRSLRVLLQVLLRPDDRLSLWQWLNTPFVGIDEQQLRLAWLSSDAGDPQRKPHVAAMDAPNRQLYRQAEQQLKQWRQWLNRLPLPELLQRIIDDLWLPELLAADPQGEQQLANIGKFVHIVAELYEQEEASLEELLRRIDDLEADESEGEYELYASDSRDLEAVRLLTIHGAKGLEFPIVVLPDLIRRQPHGHGVHILLPSAEFGLTLPQHTPAAREIAEEEKRQSAAENQRLLYVALTRARDYLLLCGPAGAKNKASEIDWWGRLHPYLETAQQAGQFRISDAAALRAQALPANAPRGTGDEADQPLWADLAERLGEIPLEPRFGSIAVTSLLSYQRCPRLFYLQSLRKIAPPYLHRRGSDLEEEADVSDSAAEGSIDKHLRFGSLIHKLCEQLTQHPDIGDEPQNLQRLLADLAPVYGYETAEMSALADLALPMLQRFLRSQPLQSLRGGRIAYSELPFSYRLPSGLMLSGMIDLLLLNDDGSLSLYDYKTNRVAAGDYAQLKQQYTLQMQVYAAAAESLLGRPLADAQLYLFNAVPGRELLPVIETASEAAQIDLLSPEAVPLYRQASLAEAERLAREMARGWKIQHFPAEPADSSICRFCGYASLCRRLRRFAWHGTSSESRSFGAQRRVRRAGGRGLADA